jgi:hypothetical protein
VPRGGTATRTGGTPAAEPEPEEAGHV